MEKYIFPAIFEPGKIKGFVVTFPDLPGCVTEGDDLHEAHLMAKEVLELHLYGMEEEGESIPEPSQPSDIKLAKGAFVTMVEVWMDLVRDEMQNKAVKKTLTIPKWLNDAAEKEGVNFSQILQYGLKEYLGITNRG